MARSEPGASKRPAAGAGAYAKAARSALENLARTLSVEWARHDITIVMVAPGPGTGDQELTELYNAWLQRHLSTEKLAKLREMAGVPGDAPVPRLKGEALRQAPKERYQTECDFFTARTSIERETHDNGGSVVGRVLDPRAAFDNLFKK